MKYLLATLSIMVLSGCEMIETGHVGLRKTFNNQIESNELQPGSFNQVLIGDVISIPVKEVGIQVNDLTPVARDNSTMKDFDAVVIYNVNPSAVSDLYTTKNKAFHAYENGDTYLMYNYITTAARNAIYIAARKYDALDMNDHRQDIETEVRQTLVKTLEDEHLETSLIIGQVLIRSIVPADTIVYSANELVKAKNSYKQKEIEEFNEYYKLLKNSQTSFQVNSLQMISHSLYSIYQSYCKYAFDKGYNIISKRWFEKYFISKYNIRSIYIGIILYRNEYF